MQIELPKHIVFEGLWPVYEMQMSGSGGGACILHVVKCSKSQKLGSSMKVVDLNSLWVINHEVCTGEIHKSGTAFGLRFVIKIKLLA